MPGLLYQRDKKQNKSKKKKKKGVKMKKEKREGKKKKKMGSEFFLKTDPVDCGVSILDSCGENIGDFG